MLYIVIYMTILTTSVAPVLMQMTKYMSGISFRLVKKGYGVVMLNSVIL